MKGDAMSAVSDLRPSPLAGTWYEADPQRLARSVDDYLDRAELPELEGEVIGVIAPHAGHRYSGPVAGYAFAAVRGFNPALVAVLSPMHQPYSQPLITTAHNAYTTPLGRVPVDRPAVDDLSRRLQARLGHGLSPVAYDHEHSLEIELPFLQRALGGEFNLLPVMVREVNPQISRDLGAALAETLSGRQSLLVASTDLSHFYSQSEADSLDGEMLKRIESFSPDALFEAEANGRGYACGLGALAAVLWAARALGADQVRILNHATSGDVTGDFSSVVGYGAAVLIRTK
jgi:AmmeMemoRadiSam system protein B